MKTNLKRLAVFALVLCAAGAAAPSHSLRSAPIHDAAAAGDAETVYRLIREYPTMLELRDERGGSPLYHAAWNGRAELVRGLIAIGAEVNVATTDGLTALHGGALNGYAEVCRALLERGADPNARSTVQGNTPLHIVWRGGYAEIAAMLIEYGAEVNAVEKWYGMTPLHYAAVYGRAELAATLLARNADTEIRDGSGRTAAQLAATADVAALFRNVAESRE